MKKVIYTCLTNGYDEVREPLKITEGWDYILLTDKPEEIKSTNWQVKEVKNPDGIDAVRLARTVKIFPYSMLNGYDLYFWCDSNLQINCDLDQFITEYGHPDAHLNIMKHHMRDCVYEEAKQCILENKDIHELINNQMAIYHDEGYPEKNGLVQTGVHWKLPTREVIKFSELWLNEVLTYSKRDQLSFNFVDWKFNQMPFSTFSAKILWNEFLISQHKHGW